MTLRQERPPLYDEAAIYQAVAHLQPGDYIPDLVYISDYENGSIPAWLIQEREPCGQGVLLTVIDPPTRHGLGYVGLELFVLPTRTLASSPYLYYAGCVHRRNQFHDIRQRARTIAEWLGGKRQGSLVLKQRNRELKSILSNSPPSGVI